MPVSRVQGPSCSERRCGLSNWSEVLDFMNKDIVDYNFGEVNTKLVVDQMRYTEVIRSAARGQECKQPKLESQ